MTIVHVGLHKTATSWFQRYVYPHVPGRRMANRELVRQTFLSGAIDDFDPVRARVALGLDEPGALPAIICEEDLSGVLHQGIVSSYIASAVAARLHATVPEARIVLFVRAQPTAAVSWYHQYVREGGTGSIHRYLFPDQYLHVGHSRPFKVPRFDFSQLDNRGLIERYDALFGREQVTVIPFEALVRDRAGVMRRLSDILGVDLPEGGSRRANSSYRAALLPLVRLANLFTARSVTDKTTLLHIPYWYTVRKTMFAGLNRLSPFGRPRSPQSMLGDQGIAWIAQRFWESNRWLATRTGYDLAAFGYPMDEPAEPVAAPKRWLPIKWMAN